MKNKIILAIAFISFGLFFTPTVFADSVVNLTIRDGDNILYAESVPLKPAGIIQLNGHDLDAGSVLSVLNDADISSDNFSITDLQYYEGMGFYLKCINTQCENWQYTVNNSYSKKAMDKNVLSGGEDVYVYFGSSHRISLNSNSITADDSLTVNAEDYLYQNNSWGPLSGVIIGVTQPDPNNTWTPIEIQTKPINDGSVVFTSLPVGSYNVGIKEDDYWPTETLIVTEAVHRSSGSSGSYISNFVKQVVQEKTFSVEDALKFLETNEKSDGSYSAPMYTDWVAIAVGAGDYQDIKLKLINYLKENDIDSSVVTDNERRTMALMALGINPYTGTKVNYIKKITDSFDGIQFGDKTLVNDDIFALVILKNAGYSANDELITKDINYIISKQDKDGSWGSIDMTAAGIQALKSFENISGVNDVILKAEKYITTNQKIDGGFENSSSTSWVLQTLFENKEILKGEAYLASKQDKDGGMEGVGTDLNTRIWITAYAIPAILHKPWSVILSNFSRQEITIENSINNDLVKQKTVYKKLNKNSIEVIKSAEDRKKIENIVDINGEVKSNKSTKMWRIFKAPFSWLFGKLGF
ncbi:MAG: prenyltransferase/squalene oxidase repeat-containing protein [Candidatus Paceibacterota bacterium]